jgi:arabinan endo-1,5-alpha-L-arabinosidase
VRVTVPVQGDSFNFVQAGLVIYGDDDNFIKLASVSIYETRQTEFAKELKPVPPGYPRYGNTVIGPPGDWTYLRIVRRLGPNGEFYTGYTSNDAQHWVRGGTWTHKLGAGAKIGLVSMGGKGFTAYFDYVRVHRAIPWFLPYLR